MDPRLIAAAIIAGDLPEIEPRQQQVMLLRNYASEPPPCDYIELKLTRPRRYKTTPNQRKQRRDKRRRYPHGW